MRWMNLEPVIQSEVSQKEENKYRILIHIYGIYKKKWYSWTYLQGRNRDANIENRLVGTAGEGESGTNWDNSIETYITVSKRDG